MGKKRKAGMSGDNGVLVTGTKFNIARRMTLGALEWLDIRRGDNNREFSSSPTDTLDMLTALAISANPYEDPDMLRKEMGAITGSRLAELMDLIPGDEAAAGNEVTGNLTE